MSNYFFQSMRHRPGAQLVKIASLSLGLLMSVFLFSRIAFELSYDTFFHEADCLYLVKTGWLKEGVPDGAEGSFTIFPIPGVIAGEFPEQVQGATVVNSLFGDSYMWNDRKMNLKTILADTLYFSVMGLDVLAGNPQELANPDILFLSESAARQIFGNENPMGQTVMYPMAQEEVPLLVRGIYRDIPLNTSLYKRPEAIVSLPSMSKHTKWQTGWQSGGNYNGFVRLRNPQDADWLNERLSAAIARHLPADGGLELSVHIVPIHSVHLDDANVMKMIWIMLFLGIVLLFTTTLNYVLLSVSSLTRRAKAIGVHKCSGASGRNIFRMFLAETACVTALALLVMGVLIWLFHEPIEELVSVPLSTLFAWQNLYAPLCVLLVLFALGGCLPAILFARIPVTQVFRRYTSGRRGWKRVLLLVQFTGAAFILGMMLVVVSQYHHLISRDRGWRPERVASIHQWKVESGLLNTHLRSLPYVEAVATSATGMMGFVSNRPVEDAQNGQVFYPRNSWFDSDYLSFIGLRLKEGSNLTGNGQLLVNVPFCKKMHWTDSPIGKQVGEYGTVVGVLDSFAFPNAPNDKGPILVEWSAGPEDCQEVRLKEPFEENLRRLNEEMMRVYPQHELVFRSVEEEIRTYAGTVRVFRNITLLASVTILFIILMGLLGYVNDEIRLRSKEIAIRKVNGAELSSVLWLLSRDVLMLAVPSILIGVCCAYKAGQVWMSRFNDLVCLPVSGYLAVGLALLAFIIGCVILKSWGIAGENPVHSLKSD